MAILEGKPGSPTPISEIVGKCVPKFVENGELIDVPCGRCGHIIKATAEKAYGGVMCPDCEAATKAQNEARDREKDIKRLGGIKAYEMFTLALYDNKKAIDLCSGFPTSNLFLWGPAGTGKTHLATAIIRSYSQGRVIKPQYINRKCRGKKDGEEEQASIDKFIYWPYLVIDELGVGSKTDFNFSTLYEIVEGRDMNRVNGLIVTSNLSLSALAERLGDDRIPSRLNGMCKIIEISGIDRRK